MSIAHAQKFTSQDYFRLPDEPRVELIQGEFLLTPAPLFTHQRISWNIASFLGDWIEEKHLGDFVCAPVDVILSEQDVVQPDLLFISKERLHLVEDVIKGAPDLVIEILSPGHQYRDRLLKKALYEKHSVREYWIVDAKRQVVTVMNLERGKYRSERTYAVGQTIRSKVVRGFEIAVAEVFRNLSLKKSRREIYRRR